MFDFSIYIWYNSSRKVREFMKPLSKSQQKILDDENYRNQVAGFTSLEALYETYTGKTGNHSEEIVSAFFICEEMRMKEITMQK